MQNQKSIFQKDDLPKIRNSIYFGSIEPSIYAHMAQNEEMAVIPPSNPTAPVLVDTSMFTESSASSLESYYPPHQEMIDAGEAPAIIS